MTDTAKSQALALLTKFRVSDTQRRNMLFWQENLPQDETSMRDLAQAFDAIELSAKSVRFLRPLQLDLNGIAKGFAVDLAINALQNLGCAAGVVNAGGDLRCFGAPIQLHLRCPRTGGLLNASFTLTNAACASSGGRLHWRKSAPDRALRPTLMGKRGRMRQLRSMTVVCSDAMTADALTKVALFAGIQAAGVLAHFGAQAHELRAQ